MAQLTEKFPQNVVGRYYVDSSCIDCDLCREYAPSNFAHHDETGFSYVYKQPETHDEEAQCQEAKDGCPVDAIGDDGVEQPSCRL